MHRFFLAPLILVVGVASALADSGTWELDPTHTTVQFAVKHLMISTVRGGFGTVSGSVKGDPAAPGSATIEAKIDVKSLDTGNSDRDTHMKGADFFDAVKYPTITFTSKKIEITGAGKAKVTGDLTLHGVTKEVVLDVSGPTPAIKDPWGNTKAGASATTRINRKDFGMVWNKTMDGGGLVVGEEIDVTIDVEAKRTGS